MSECWDITSCQCRSGQVCFSNGLIVFRDKDVFATYLNVRDGVHFTCFVFTTCLVTSELTILTTYFIDIFPLFNI